MPERIKHNLHAFPPRELRSRYEIGIPGNQDDNVCLAFQRDRRDVQPDSHIDSFLPQGRCEVVIAEFVDRQAAIQKPPLRLRLQNPEAITILANLTQPHGEIRTIVQGFEQPLSESRLVRPGIVDDAFINGRVLLAVVGLGVK